MTFGVELCQKEFWTSKHNSSLCFSRPISTSSRNANRWLVQFHVLFSESVLCFGQLIRTLQSTCWHYPFSICSTKVTIKCDSSWMGGLPLWAGGPACTPLGEGQCGRKVAFFGHRDMTAIFNCHFSLSSRWSWGRGPQAFLDLFVAMTTQESPCFSSSKVWFSLSLLWHQKTSLPLILESLTVCSRFGLSCWFFFFSLCFRLPFSLCAHGFLGSELCPTPWGMLICTN